MLLYEFIQSLVDAQNCGVYYEVAANASPRPVTMPGVCPAAAFTAIGAAFQTIGYWVQADLIDYLTLTKFGLWAPLFYIMAAFGGLFSMAMGAPPKNYLWFFIGPALYAWLLDTRQEVHGVQWMVAGIPQDQRMVWRHTEVGIINTNLHFRMTSGGRGQLVHAAKVPDEKVAIAMPFLWFDELVSHSVQWLVSWTGVNRLQTGEYASDKRETNIIGLNSPFEDRGWHLLSHSKWSYFDSITSAKLTSPELRDAFVTFTASECGDALFSALDDGKFIAASHSKGRTVPHTVFKTTVPVTGPASIAKETYDPVFNKLNIFVPFPGTLKRILKEFNEESASFLNVVEFSYPGEPATSDKFVDSISWKKLYYSIGGFRGGLVEKDMIRCDTYLDILVFAFRWEAAHQYYQIMAQRPEHMSDLQVINNLMYGWAVKDSQGRSLGSSTDYNFPPEEQIRNFIYNLILVYLMRNEIAIAKQPMDLRYASATQIQNVTEGWQRSLGSKTKYGELYTWALMIPYIQGVLLYLLTIAYPFCAVAMVVPGWHKTLLTWASFFAWVKLWAVGFAIVMTIDRSLWAMLGNSSAAKGLLNRVADMQSTGQSFALSCNESGGVGHKWEFYNSAGAMCDTPIVWLRNVLSGSDKIAENIPEVARANLRLFDYGMTLGPNLDLDLANGYYIYILTALYFAVPVVTGQLVLGAKAGAASMVSNAIGGISSESGRAAGASYQGDIVQRMKSNQAGIAEQAYAKEMRKGGINGLAGQALQNRRQASAAGLLAAKQRAVSSGEQALASAAVTGTEQAGLSQSAAFGSVGVAMAALGINPQVKPGGASPRQEGVVNTGGADKSSSVSSTALPSAGSVVPDGYERNNKARSLSAEQLSRLFGQQTVDGKNPFLDKVMGMLGKGAKASPAALYEAAQHAGRYQLGTQANQAKIGYSGRSSDASISDFLSGQLAGAYEKNSGMLGAQANYNARRAQWRELNNYGNRMGGTATALGLHAGGLDAGPKPFEMDGMAMSGMLNGGGASEDRSLQRAANFWNQGQRGGLQGIIRRTAALLSDSYDSDQIRDKFMQYGGGRSVQSALENAGMTALPQLLDSGIMGNKNAVTPIESFDKPKAR